MNTREITIGLFAEETINSEGEAVVDTNIGYWEGPIGFEDVLTGDGRMIAANALYWGELPLPFRSVSEDSGGHDHAQAVGRILTIERRDGDVIWASGDFDRGTREGDEAYRMMKEGYRVGVSMDLDSISFEVRVKKELLEEMPEDEYPVDEDGNVVVYEQSAGDEINVLTEANIRAATLVDIPAFQNAKLSVTDNVPEAVTASAGPVAPPAEWFMDPQLKTGTALTVTPEGHVYGHIALWGTCHTGQQGVCVQPPHSNTSYRNFMTGSLLTSDGTMVPVGHLTMSTIHPSLKLRATAATRHYDDTGTVAADVIVGEDSHGIWFSGALRSTLTDAQVREFRAAPLSGDWREIGRDGLDLIAVLAVNTPGFPVPRASGAVESGSQLSLVASAGMVAPEEPDEEFLSVSDISFLKSLANRERSKVENKGKADELAGRVARADLARRAASLGVL